MDYIGLYNANLQLKVNLLKSLDKVPWERLVWDRSFWWKTVWNCLEHDKTSVFC